MTKLKLFVKDFLASIKTHIVFFIIIILGVTGCMFASFVAYGNYTSHNLFHINMFYRIFQIETSSSTENHLEYIGRLLNDEKLSNKIDNIVIGGSSVSHRDEYVIVDGIDDKEHKLETAAKGAVHFINKELDEYREMVSEVFYYEEDEDGINPIIINSRLIGTVFENGKIGDIIEISGSKYRITGKLGTNKKSDLIIPYRKYIEMFDEFHIIVSLREDVELDKNDEEYFVSVMEEYLDEYSVILPSRFEEWMREEKNKDKYIIQIIPLFLSLLGLLGILSFYIRRREKDLRIYKRCGMSNIYVAGMFLTQIIFICIISFFLSLGIFAIAYNALIELDPNRMTTDIYSIKAFLGLFATFTVATFAIVIFQLRNTFFKKYNPMGGSK